MTPATSSFSDAALRGGMTVHRPGGRRQLTVTELDENHARVERHDEYANGGGPVVHGRNDRVHGAGAGDGSCAPGIATPDGGFGGAGGATGTGGAHAVRRAAGGGRGGARRGGRGGTTGTAGRG